LKPLNASMLGAFLLMFGVQIGVSQPVMATDSNEASRNIFINNSTQSSVKSAVPGNKQYQVKHGDTLIGIAKKFSPEQGMSLWKMMVALVRENPAAFKGKDVNNLIVGAVLRVPGKAKAKRVASPKTVNAFNKPRNAIARADVLEKTPDNQSKTPIEAGKGSESDTAIAQASSRSKISDSQNQSPYRSKEGSYIEKADSNTEVQARYRTELTEVQQQQPPRGDGSRELEDEQEGISSTVRLGYVSNKSEGQSQQETLALGGQFRLQTPVKNGFAAGVGFYSTNALFGVDENPAFLGAQGEAYTIAGESWLAFEAGDTQLKAGRQAVDTPFADTDDIAMMPNTFEGVVVTNNDIQAIALTLLHLRKWASRDNDAPELFTDMNEDKGVNALGVSYSPTESISLQAWHYQASDLSKMSYLELGGGDESLHLALQYTRQTDDTVGGSGDDNNAWGVLAEHSIGDFTLSTAYNRVSGEVSNGFGGGPYFTSTEDHTIDGIVDEKAVMLGLEYTGFASLTLALMGTDFDQSEDEADAIISYSFDNGFSTDIIYSDMSDDGDMTKVFVNYDF